MMSVIYEGKKIYKVELCYDKNRIGRETNSWSPIPLYQVENKQYKDFNDLPPFQTSSYKEAKKTYEIFKQKYDDYYDSDNKLIRSESQQKVKFKKRITLNLSSRDAAVIKSALMLCTTEQEMGKLGRDECWEIYNNILKTEFQQAEKKQ
jgi:hypothetical protein